MKKCVIHGDLGKILKVYSKYGTWIIKITHVSRDCYYFDTATGNMWVETGNGQLYQDDCDLEYEELPRLTIMVLGMNQWPREAVSFSQSK